MSATDAGTPIEVEREPQLRLDAADVFRIGDQRPDRCWLDPVPPESIQHQPGDRVLVWATREEGSALDLLPGTVLEYDDSPEGAGRFAVRLDRPGGGRKRVVTYANGPPRRSAVKDTFSHAYRAGHCGALERRRIFVRLYAVPPPTSPPLLGERSGWRGLLVGPGARPLGRLFADMLLLQPDADKSSTAIGDGEHYWLNLRGSAGDEVRTRVVDAARKAWTAYTPLLRLLERGQSLSLHRVSETEVCLSGSNAHALAAPLRVAVRGAALRMAPTTCARVAREALWLSLTRVAALTAEEPLEQRVRTAVEAALPQLDLPPTTLLGRGEEAPSMPRSTSGWLLSVEGPDARRPGVADAAWQGAYVCPANTLAVTGPRAEVSCLLNYAIQQGAAPICVQAEELPPERYRLSFSTPARAAAAVAGGAGGLSTAGGWQHKREQARGRYYGPWELCVFSCSQEPSSEAAEREEAEERLLMEDVMGAWNPRNVRNQLEGQICMVPPSALEVRLRLRPHCPAMVEYEDFRDLQDAEVFCAQGPMGAGSERLWNPAYPSASRPEGWVVSAAPEYSARLLVLCLPGAAFQLAKARESVEVKLQQRALSLLEGSALLRRRLQGAFRAQRKHVHPVPLPDWRGDDAVEGVTPLPFCPSLHPQLLRQATAPEVSVPDLEDWAQAVTQGALPCSLCGGDVPECQRRMNDKVPGLVTVAPRSGSLVATFPSLWRPRPARLQPRLAPALPGCAALADDTASCALPPAAPVADVRAICCAARSVFRERWSDLEPTMALCSVRPEGAKPGVRCLARYLVEQAFRPAAELRQALPLARSGQALTTLVGAARAILPPGSEAAVARDLLGQQLQALRLCSPAWNIRLLLGLAALPDTQEDAAGLASLLRCVSSGVEAEAGAAVAAWVGESPEAALAGLRRLFHVLGERSQRKRWSSPAAQEQRACFVQALSAARAPPNALRLSARFLLAARGPHPTLSTEPSSWGPASLGLWAQRTAAWEDETSAAALLGAASEAGLAADQVLALFARGGGTGAAEFKLALEALRRGSEEEQREQQQQPARSAAQRTREQLIAPEAGERRWSDAQQQPEHQALLLAHVLRELLTQLASLACDSPREVDFDETTALLRGDPEHLAAEAQHQPRLPPRGAGGLWDDELTRDVLTRGSSSLSHLTGGCVPRRVAWLDGSAL